MTLHRATMIARAFRPRARSALGAVALAAVLAPPAGAQCGETTEVNPARSPVAARPPLAVGDSVLYGAADAVASEGFAVNAMVCRQISQGIALLRARAGTLPPLVVVELGTNGPVTPSDIDELLAILGPSRTLALVTPHNGVSPGTPAIMRRAARAHPGRVIVLDWDRYSARHPDWLAPDGIHLGGAAGIAAFARLIAGALPYATPLAPATPPPTPSTTTAAVATTKAPASPHRLAGRRRASPAVAAAARMAVVTEAVQIAATRMTTSLLVVLSGDLGDLFSG